VANLNTTNAIGLVFRLFGVANKSRIKLDGAAIGFPATPSANRQETVLSPAGPGNVPPATKMTLTVNSFICVRSSGKISVKVIRADLTNYTQVVDAIFMMSPDQAVTVEIVTGEAFNVSALAIWS
jgi:hypothetical protein